MVYYKEMTDDLYQDDPPNLPDWIYTSWSGFYDTGGPAPCKSGWTQESQWRCYAPCRSWQCYDTKQYRYRCKKYDPLVETAFEVGEGDLSQMDYTKIQVVLTITSSTTLVVKLQSAAGKKSIGENQHTAGDAQPAIDAAFEDVLKPAINAAGAASNDTGALDRVDYDAGVRAAEDAFVQALYDTVVVFDAELLRKILDVLVLVDDYVKWANDLIYPDINKRIITTSLATFDEALPPLIEEIRADLDDAVTNYQVKTDLIITALGTYFSNNPVNRVISGDSMMTAITNQINAAYGEIQHMFDENDLAYNGRVQTANSDFGNAYNDVIFDLQDSIGGLVTLAPDYDYIFGGLQDTISDRSEELMGDVSAVFTEMNEKVGAISKEMSDRVHAVTEVFETDRAIIRFTGGANLPSYVTLDEDNTFSFEFENVGTKSWTGWAGFRLVDQYNKVVEENKVQNVTTIPPTGKAFLIVTLLVPAKVNKKSLGATLEYTLLVNTQVA